MKNHDRLATPQSSETFEKPTSKFKKITEKILSWKQEIAERLGLSGRELIKAVDEALVISAQEAVVNADKDGVRTDSESAEIRESFEIAVVEGAMEEAGLIESEHNPIDDLNRRETSDELVAAIGSLHSDEVTLPDGREVAELAVDVIERAKWNHMIPLEGGPRGRNDGGWYQDPETGDKYYVKFYENPNQGKVEFITNAIYDKLGVKAVHSELVEVGGREGVASKEIPNVRNINVMFQHDSKDVRDGFVADAYLANWDVIGLSQDNIVTNGDSFYRIDNGGSMMFRALGGPKEFARDDIPELQSMRTFWPANAVFGDITESEIRVQAQDLLGNLSPRDIKSIVARSGLRGALRDKALAGLLGRREFLAHLYGENGNVQSEPRGVDSAVSTLEDIETGEQTPRKGLGDMIADIRGRRLERIGENEVRPRAELICDGSHIEDQRIDIINKQDFDKVELSFKLRNQSVIKNMAISGKTASGVEVSGGVIKFESSSNHDDVFEASDALTFGRNGVTVLMATPETKMHAMSGVVKIEIPNDIPPEEAERLVARIMEEDFQIPDGLGEVSEEDEGNYKKSLYCWHHKIEGDPSPEEIEAAERLERREVFPGYTTMVEPGKHREYADKYGDDLRAIHKVSASNLPQSIYGVLTSGLMASSERLSRGMMHFGMSATEDFSYGSANYAFTRIQSEAMRQEDLGVVIVFKPELLDRTDWFVYKYDHFGQTNSEIFRMRETPDSMMKKIADHPTGYSHNEQMFKTGIGAQYVEKIYAGSWDRNIIIDGLKEMGLEVFDGRPIEEVVVLRDNDNEDPDNLFGTTIFPASSMEGLMSDYDPDDDDSLWSDINE